MKWIGRHAWWRRRRGVPVRCKGGGRRGDRHLFGQRSGVVPDNRAFDKRRSTQSWGLDVRAWGSAHCSGALASRAGLKTSAVPRLAGLCLLGPLPGPGPGPGPVGGRYRAGSGGRGGALGTALVHAFHKGRDCDRRGLRVQVWVRLGGQLRLDQGVAKRGGSPRIRPE